MEQGMLSFHFSRSLQLICTSGLLLSEVSRSGSPSSSFQFSLLLGYLSLFFRAQPQITSLRKPSLPLKKRASSVSHLVMAPKVVRCTEPTDDGMCISLFNAFASTRLWVHKSRTCVFFTADSLEPCTLQSTYQTNTCWMSEGFPLYQNIQINREVLIPKSVYKTLCLIL